jgi:hypothetical protein
MKPVISSRKTQVTLDIPEHSYHILEKYTAS